VTSRHKMLTALRTGLDHDFPVIIPYVGIFVRDHWEQFTDRPFWYRQYGTPRQQLEWMADLLRAVPLDWLPVPLGLPHRWYQTHEVVAREGGWVLRDLNTGSETLLRRERPGGNQVVQSRRPVLVRTLADLDGVLPLPTEEDDASTGCFDLPRLARKVFPDQCLAGAVAAPFWQSHAYLGFAGLMTAVGERAGLLTALLERLTLRAEHQIRRLAAAGVYDVVWVEDCYSSADLISLPQFRRFALPYAARIVAALDAAGLASIYYFCGKVDERLDDLADLRPTALSLEESKKDFQIDLSEVAERVAGRTGLLGNLDAIHTLRLGTRAELRAALEAQLTVGQRVRRFVFSLGSPVTADTPLSRVQDYLALSRELAASDKHLQTGIP